MEHTDVARTTARPRTDDPPPSRPGGSWLPLLAVSLGFFMVILDVTVVTVAVPVVGERLAAGPTALQWVVDGYTLVFAALMLLSGGLGDRFGHRRAFLAGLIVFTVASAACGAATSVAVLIAARLVQGAGAALLVPASLALLRAAYPERAARARAFGVWAAVSGLGAAAGPVAGGLAVWGLSWRAVFLVNVPFGLLAVVFTLRCVPAPEPRAGVRLRLPAQLACLVSVAALTAALNEGGTLGWRSPWVLGCLAVSVASGLMAAPLLRAAVGTEAGTRGSGGSRRGLIGGTAVGVLLNFGIYGLVFLTTLYFQRQRGYGPLTAGLALLPMFAVMTVSSFVSGRMTARTGPRTPLVVGLLTGAAGLAGWLLAGAHTPYGLLAVPMALAGAGTSFAMPAATTSVMESASAGHDGTAAALLNAGRQLGSALGVALFGSLSARHLLSGMHVSAVLAATAFVAGAATAALTASALGGGPSGRALSTPAARAVAGRPRRP